MNPDGPNSLTSLLYCSGKSFQDGDGIVASIKAKILGARCGHFRDRDSEVDDSPALKALQKGPQIVAGLETAVLGRLSVL
jgi:hypothetical protein